MKKVLIIGILAFTLVFSSCGFESGDILGGMEAMMQEMGFDDAMISEVLEQNEKELVQMSEDLEFLADYLKEEALDAVDEEYKDEAEIAKEGALEAIEWAEDFLFYEGNMTFAELQVKFPDGKFWNHVGKPGNGPAQNNQDGWTNTPCPRHFNCGTSTQTCNGFQPAESSGQLSHQCMGFAEKLGFDITGFNPREDANGWVTYKNSSALDNLKAGDIVRYKNGGHSIFVTAVDGETVTYVDCNGGDLRCEIRWNETITKSTLRDTFTHLRSAPFEAR